MQSYAKQKRVRREPTIDGMDAEDFIRQNADPIWLHQNEYWEILEERAMEEQEAPDQAPPPRTRRSQVLDDSDHIAF